MRWLWMVWLTQGCAYISDEHESWRLDPDEDGVGIADDCDNDDASIGAKRAWYRDVDQDGFGDEADASYSCTKPDGFASEAGDCDDSDGLVFPGADEVCDGADNNCDGQTDEGLPVVTVYEDRDGDGYGDAQASVEACGPVDGRVDNPDDCDDSNPFLREQRPLETYFNGIDDNCDESDGDGDSDGDGYWAVDYVAQLEALGLEPMPAPEGMDEDCDDSDATVYPGAEDVWYDGIDSNCGGEDDCDIDGDGYQAAEGVCGPEDLAEADCNDHDPAVNPGAAEVCASDADENCDGDTVGVDAPDCITWFQDFDSDGFGQDGTEICQCTSSFPHTATDGGDCDDTEPSYYPGAFDVPRDGRDMDCAGDDDWDGDGDGYVSTSCETLPEGCATEGVPTSLPGGDCDDDDPSVFPSAEEACDEVDRDCDGEVDEGIDLEGCRPFFADADGDGFGDDDDSVCMCLPTDDWPVAVGGDCVDFAPSSSGPADDTGLGASDTGETPSGEAFSGFGPADYYPGAPDPWYDGEDTDCEGNDDFDQDRDGHSDAAFGEESATGRLTSEGTIEILAETEIVPPRIAADDCDDTDGDTYPSAPELCDGVDNDCDGEVDGDVVESPLVFPDLDDDGFGDADSVGEFLCVESGPGTGWAIDGGDCDDADVTVYPDAPEACDFVDSDCDGDLADEFYDLDRDGEPDCVDDVLIGDLEVAEGAQLLVGLPDSRAGASLFVGREGEVFIGAPSVVGLHSRVYVVDGLAPGPVDLELDAAILRRATDGFGTALGQLGSGSLLVGSPLENAVVRVDEPAVGHEITHAPSTDDFMLLDSVVSGSEDACGSTILSGRLVDVGAAEAVFVGCPGTNGPSHIYRPEDHIGDMTFSAIGWAVGTGLEAGDVDEFGRSAASGDLDGDGIEDLLVGAPRADAERVTDGGDTADTGRASETVVRTDSGGIYVYNGVAAATDVGDWDARLMGQTEASETGRLVQVTSDLDGDGIPDVLLSSNTGRSTDPLAGRTDTGTILILSGASIVGDVDLGAAEVRVEGTEAGSFFALQARILSDADGDGRDELLVSAYNAGGDLSGAIYGFREAWTPGTRSQDDGGVLVIRGLPGSEFGRTMSYGDVGADGADDLLVSEPGFDRVWLIEPSAIFHD